MKLQHIAAAVALAAAGSAAHAAMATGGNGSLVMIAYDKLGGTTTAGMFDLGLTLDDFAGATGNGSGFAAGSLATTVTDKMVWNFNTNTLTIDGVVATSFGSNDWTAAWTRLLANADAADLQYVVTAFDTVGIGANNRTLATGVFDPTAQQLNNSASQATGLQAVAGGKANDIFLPQNGSLNTGAPAKGTHGTADNGAYTFTAEDGAATRANAYAMAGDAFGNNWRNNNLLNGETFDNHGTALWLLDGLKNEAKAPFIVRLNASQGTLTMSAVPEPSTYAMFIAGLTIAGVVARRRRAA